MTRDKWLVDRERVQAQARAMMDMENLAVLDTETTGLDGYAEIVQVAVVDCASDVLLDSLVKPTRPVPAEATAVHGIGDGDLLHAPTLVQIDQQLKTTLEGRFVAVYNADFDFRVLNQSLRAQGIREIGRSAAGPHFLEGDLVVNSACVMEMYACWHGAWHEYFQSYTWQSLGNAIQQCGLEFDGKAHSALADAKATLAVLRFLAGEF